ncbi:MAG: DUF333 domain-containing protein [Patescibacteria group bacterium]
MNPKDTAIFLIIIGVALVAIFAIVIAPQISPAPVSTQRVGIANPASTYCAQEGGTLQIRTDANGGQYGMCLTKDGRECEEWSYFRGGCDIPKGSAPSLQ